MKLPSHIERKLRETATQSGMSEAQYIQYRDFLLNLAKIQIAIDTRKRLKKLTRAA